MTTVIDHELIPQKLLYDGNTMPGIGMGTFGSDRFTPEQVANAVFGAIKAGYRFFDCAACYGNEPMIGDVFKRAFDESIVKREELFIDTKVWNDMHGQGDVLLSCAKSLRDLKLDYMDLLFVHWPFPNYHAPGCDVDSRNPDSRPFSVDEFMAAWHQLEKLVDMGLVRYIGMSNMTIPKLDVVLPLCRIKPATIEMEMHPTFQQEELFQYCKERQIEPIAFCPIGSPTRPERDMTAEDLTDIKMPELVAIAKAHNVHPAIICIKWAVQRGHTPIPFSIHEAEYTSNLKCITEDPLTDNEMELLKSLERNNRLIKGQVFLWEKAKDWKDLWDLDGTITK